MNPQEDLSPASRLCLACGMCCDGTLHGLARLLAEDVDAARAVGFPTFTTPDGRPAMPLPCHCLSGTACTRYDDWRPSICASYLCNLQTRLSIGEYTETEALDIIASALKARAQVEELMPQGTTLRDARIRFEELAASKQALAPADARLVVRMFALERWLDRHFRKPNAATLPTGCTANPPAKPDTSATAD